MAAVNPPEIRRVERTPGAAGRPSRLWWWVGVVFALQLTVWVAWLIFAAHHPVEEIPLVQRS